ncbi:MAG TPA: hypothetical protein VN956_20540 [Pyrinomonadaceae bacterium]|nr:hypothetical protein [Pyrinomonadaceae bacterium]
MSAKSLDDYLLDVGNQTIYQELERIGLTPLPFFDLFYKLIDLVKQGKPSQALEELNEITPFQAGGLRLFVLNCIRENLRDYISLAAGWSKDTEHESALFVIDKEYDEVAKRFPPDLFPDDPDNSISDRARQEVAQSQMVHKLLGEMIKRDWDKAREREKLEQEIELRARQDEREKLETTINETVQAAIAAASPKRNPEHTLNRQVLALGFILKRLNVQNIDKSDQARFVEFLIGKTYKDIYDNLRELDDRVLHRKGEDARFVIAQFEKLGLNDIAKEIEETLNKFNL